MSVSNVCVIKETQDSKPCGAIAVDFLKTNYQFIASGEHWEFTVPLCGDHRATLALRYYGEFAPYSVQ